MKTDIQYVVIGSFVRPFVAHNINSSFIFGQMMFIVSMMIVYSVKISTTKVQDQNYDIEIKVQGQMYMACLSAFYKNSSFTIDGGRSYLAQKICVLCK